MTNTVLSQVIAVCRLCLATNDNDKFMSLFEPFRNATVVKHILSFADIKISKEDGLPEKICKDCIIDLEKVIAFKEKCEATDIFLRNNFEVVAYNKEVSVVVKKEEEDEEQDNINFLDTSIEFDEVELPNISQDENLCAKLSSQPQAQLQCHDCNDFFKSKCKLRVHWKKVHLPCALLCSLCKRAFKSFKTFNRHKKNKSRCVNVKKIQVEGEGKNRRFNCVICQYSTLSLTTMMTHSVIHTGERPYKCNLCTNSYTQHSSLISHKENIHQKYRVEMTCPHCGKFVKGRNKVYRHLKKHSTARYQCDTCKKFFKSKLSLSVHLRRHSGIKSYTCEICGSRFYSNPELCNHRKYVHSKVKPVFSCDICEYKSIRKHIVKKHKAKHSDKNVSCFKCGMFFENELKLNCHMRVHFGERKFACTICDAKFLRKDTLYKHFKAKHQCEIVIDKLKQEASEALKVQKKTPVIRMSNKASKH